MVGLLCVQMFGGSLNQITVTDANITVISGIHESVYAQIGGIAFELIDGVTAQNLRGENIHITVTGGGYRVGSLFGRSAYRRGTLSLEHAVVRGCTIRTEDDHAAGVIGQATAPRLLRDILAEDCSISSGGFAASVVGQYLLVSPGTSLAEDLHAVNNTLMVLNAEGTLDAYCGGLFGQYNTDNIHTLRNCTVKNGVHVGGLAGGIELTGPQVIQNCHVTGTSVESVDEDAGGFAGRPMG